MLTIALLILRLAVGLTVAAHGAQKLFGWFHGPGIDGFTGALTRMGIRPARPFAVLAALAEFGGGLMVAAGLLTPLSAMAVVAAMLVAIFAVHVPKGFFNQAGGYEFPNLILWCCVAIAIAGPGPASLDHALGLALPEPATLGAGAVLALLGAGVALLSPRLRESRKPQLP
jgi:putative oxidoreductase